VGLGLYFIFLRPPLLPDDPRFMGATLEQIQHAVPGLAGWLRRVFTVMGGFMAAAGVLTLLLASHLETLRRRFLVVAIAVAGVFGVGLMSAVNFAIHSDSRWLLLMPALLWLAACVAMLGNRATRQKLN
jgi:CHASE2 domain-containing sensor protein